VNIACHRCGEEFRWQGRLPVRCEKCRSLEVDEQREQRIRELPRLLAEAWIPERYRGCTKEAWDGRWPSPPKRDESTTLIFGPVGRGKTHLATALLIEELKDHGFGKWIGCARLVGDLRRSFDGGKGGGSVVMSELLRTPFLVLDDFPPDHMTEFALGTLTELMHARYDSMLHTVVTTNLDARGLNDVSARMASRYISGRVVNLTGGVDMRIHKPGR
jgi:DNA-directed RNA polymerase subunit RPC12/RpoP